jgi:hypothetical protein
MFAMFYSCRLFGQINSSNSIIHKNKELKSSIEGSVLLPFYPGNELLIKYTRTLWDNSKFKGEFVTGIHFHLNTKRDGGRYDDYQVILGYRQYLYKNFAIEVALQPKVYYRFQNSPYSNRNHEGFGLFAYTLIGYRFEPIKREKYSLFLNVQPIGFALGFYHTDNWPKDTSGNTDDSVIYYGNIALGICF